MLTWLAPLEAVEGIAKAHTWTFAQNLSGWVGTWQIVQDGEVWASGNATLGNGTITVNLSAAQTAMPEPDDAASARMGAAGSIEIVATDGTATQVFQAAIIILRRLDVEEGSGGGIATASVPASSGAAWDVAMFGVVYDCVKQGGRWVGTDATAALQAAMNAASTARKTLIVSGNLLIAHKPGKDVFAITPPSWVHMVGVNGGTICQDYDPAEVISGNTYKGFAVFQSPTWPANTEVGLTRNELFRLENLTFRGLWDVHPRARKQDGTRLVNYDRVELIDVNVFDWSGRFCVVDYGDSALVQGGRYINLASGSVIRARYFSNIIVDGIYHNGSADDAIDCHATDGTPNDPAFPVRSTLIIKNSIFENGRGVVCLGGVDMTVIGCSFNRTYGAINFSGNNDGEGQGAVRNIVIMGNKFIDQLRRADEGVADDNNPILPTGFDMSNRPSVVALGNCFPAGTGGVAAPRQWDATLGTIVPPYYAYPGMNAGALWSRDSQSALAGAPATGIIVSDNHFYRTLPLDSDFGDYGFGGLFTHYGFYEPAITFDSFCTYGVSFIGPMNNARVTGNLISGGLTRSGINLDPNTASTRAYDQVLIDDNIIEDVPRCISRQRADEDSATDGTIATDTWGIVIRNNWLRCDPFLTMPTRTAATGAWASVSNIYGIGISLPGISGITVDSNIFQDMSRCIRANAGSELATWTLRGNIVRGGIQQIAFSTSNLGVGEGIDAPQSAVIYQDTVTTVSSALYGAVTATPLSEANASPGAGCFYRRGHFVPHSAPAIASGKVQTGWIRLTSGRGAVAGTDWTPVFQTIT